MGASWNRNLSYLCFDQIILIRFNLILNGSQIWLFDYTHRKHLRLGPYLLVFCFFWCHLLLFDHDRSFFIQILIKFVSWVADIVHGLLRELCLVIELRHLLRGLRVVSMHNVCEDRQTHLVFQINLIFSDMTIFIALILINPPERFIINLLRQVYYKPLRWVYNKPPLTGL